MKDEEVEEDSFIASMKRHWTISIHSYNRFMGGQIVQILKDDVIVGSFTLNDDNPDDLRFWRSILRDTSGEISDSGT
jgi:hypothetical protein